MVSDKYKTLSRIGPKAIALGPQTGEKLNQAISFGLKTGYSIWSYERKNWARNGLRAIAFGNRRGNRNKPKADSFGPQTEEKSDKKGLKATAFGP